MTAIKALAKETATDPEDWEEISGPDSGVGIDHWFVNRFTDEEAYVNEDQGEFSVSVGAEA